MVNASKWLTLAAPTGSITTTATLPFTLDPTGLAPGYYFDTLRVATSLGNLNVPITLFVGTPPASLNVEPNGLRFDVRQGQGSPISQTLKLYQSGPAGSLSNWSARVISGANLIQLSATSGTATLGNPSTISVSLAGTATDTLGPAYAVIEVSSPNAPSEYVTVVANVTATGTPAPPLLDPVSLVLVAPQGGAPVTQRVQINLSELNPTSFTATFSGGAGALTATPVTNAASTTSPGLVDITFTPGSLAPGGYTGLFNVTAGGVQLRTTRVLLIVQPPAGTTCTPTGLRVRETSIIERFGIPSGWPQPLTAQLYDNCGNRVKTGTVTASFSNGDPSIRLNLDEATGDFFTTWTPQTALNTGIKVTLRPTSGNLFNANLDISGTVTGNATPPPILAPGGILNNLNPIIGAPLAPGTVVQVYGNNFYTSDGFASAAAPPLNPRFQGAQLLVSGSPAPFYYISRTQAAAQIPTELTPGRTYSALMEVNGAFSAPLPVEVVPTTPGTVSSGSSLIAQHASDYQLVTAQNPAKPNEALVMYLVGMGATNPAVPTGAPAPFDPPAKVSEQPTVTIGGQTATILFAGLTPGFAGLYQINFIVPATTRDGDLDVVITQNNVTANPTKLTVKK
jgi:adhesin/invasin